MNDDELELAEQKRNLEKTIRFHEDGLAQYRQVMSISAQYLVSETIKYLKELQEVKYERF